MAPDHIVGNKLAVGIPDKQQQQQRRRQKGVYVTFLAGDGDYVKGVVGLAKGLRKVGSAYPLVVAVLPDVPESHRRLLRTQGCLVREIEPVYPPENQTRFAMAYYVINYSKLRIWQFVEYKKMVYLDADIQDFLNMFFRDVYKPIPLVYNLVMAMLWRHPENVVLDDVKVVHYCAAGSKPWRYTGKEENMDREDIKMLVKRWWDVYNDESLNYRGPPVPPEPEDLNQPLMAALSEAGVLHYITAPSAA
ncbi:hypothetical protein Taro_032336 [Colocasia esculenta]|uniref:Hexosyltransferase n=1 Tax=Colocasia esculenta TaxID=4460 RepID=A0A843W958_COLES|nr:hypothetical protein [Colocasia esculenta]